MEIKDLDLLLDKYVKEHIRKINKYELKMFIVSTTYPGVWLEHVYDSLMYGYLYNDYSIAKNTILNFIASQNEYGAYPYAIKDLEGTQYYQIQECVSFIGLAYKLYLKINDIDFLKKVYDSGKKYVSFIYKYRMTLSYGLPEMFVGYDCGHDNSQRVLRLNVSKNDKSYDSRFCPINSDKTIALDLSSNLYMTLVSLAKMAKILKKDEEEKYYNSLAKEIKEKIFTLCYDKESDYFYDLDFNGRKIFIKSSTIFHLFQERVLDKDIDKELIERIYNKYIHNEKEFWAPYPFPSVSLSEKDRLNYKIDNSWGYYSEALIALRASLWMDYYGYSKDYDQLLNKWVKGIIKNFKYCPLSQELDPDTGVASMSSPNYSSTIVLIKYAIKRLKLNERK